MLTALRDRPTHLQRFPDGVDGEQIYQKRIPRHRPDYLQTCRVTFPSGRMADALKVTHPAAIVWAAQMGTITLHPWQVRCPDTEHPDELRIDLDPQPGTGFVEARTVAVDVLRSVLDDLGLVGYPKTSGGRGIHVFLRIATDWDFVEVRRAGIALAREVERRAPDAVTTSWWKEERGARIFIDFNQNARDRTMASAYSVRPTPIATVSMPLTWEELAGADPDDYTMTTVPELVKIRDDPWAGMDDVAQSIAPLLDLAAADEERGLGDMPYPPNYPKMPGEPKRVQPSRDTDLKGETRRSNAVRLAPQMREMRLVCPTFPGLSRLFRDHQRVSDSSGLYRGACERCEIAHRVVANAVVGEDLRCGDVQGGDPRVDAVDHVQQALVMRLDVAGAQSGPFEDVGVVGDGSGVGDAGDPRGQWGQLRRQAAVPDSDIGDAGQATRTQNPSELLGGGVLVRECAERALAHQRVECVVGQRD